MRSAIHSILISFFLLFDTHLHRVAALKMTDYKDIKEATAGVPSTHVQAPTVTASLYAETIPTLYMSELAYGLTLILRESQRANLKLDIPKDFPVKDLDRYLTESIDFIKYDDGNYNNGNGMSFYDVNTLVKANNDILVDLDNKKGKGLMQTILKDTWEELEGEKGMKEVFLTHIRYIQESVACVYVVVKDTINKRIIVSFRGSQMPFDNLTRDWRTNLNAYPSKIPTPEKIKHKMKGKLQEEIRVHNGFRNYLFKNDRIDEQRYETIISDIRAAINGEKGYSVYITGHSLGGALATMFSCVLAGCGGEDNDIPRPVTCISFAAPFSGTQGYRTAIEHLERDGFLRHLRVVNGEDYVPTLPFLSLLRTRLMKQVGINLRLTSSGFRLEHSSRANFMTALRNTFFKPFIWRMFRFGRWHGLPLLKERIKSHADEFKNMKLDDLYTDESIVSSAFVAGNI